MVGNIKIKPYVSSARQDKYKPGKYWSRLTWSNTYTPCEVSVFRVERSVDFPGSTEGKSTPTPTMFLYAVVIHFATSSLIPAVICANLIRRHKVTR